VNRGLPPSISPLTGLVAATHPASRLLRISPPTTTADWTMPPPAWVPHRETALRTLGGAITQCRTHGVRLDWRSYSRWSSNNLRNHTV